MQSKRSPAQRICFWVLLALGIALRAWAFGAVPAGLNQDEAYAGYEAFNLLHYGMDSYGYHNPVYLTTWGSGMSALQSWIMIPFMALLGRTEVAIRLPQLLCGCLTLPVFYLLLRELYCRRTALLGMGLLAVSPWHIMLCRWALDFNLAPFFLLLGLYFFARGVKDARWWPASAAAYGVSLYAYAIDWIVVPLTLLLFLVCILRIKPEQLRTRWLAVSAAVLFLLALPLLLFLAVNQGLLPEIVTPWLSIPRMPVLRAAEIWPGGLLDPGHWCRLLKLLFLQQDGFLWNSTHYGLFYYYLSVPFFLLGLGLTIWQAIRHRGGWGTVLPLAGFTAALLISLMITDLNVNRGNALHLYTLLFITRGGDWLLTRSAGAGWRRWALRAVQGAVSLVLVLSVVKFSRFYFTAYNQRAESSFRPGIEEALMYIKERDFRRVWVEGSTKRSLLLFYDPIPAPEFFQQAVYAEYEGEKILTGFGRYVLESPASTLEGCDAYLMPAGTAPGFDCPVRVFGRVAVVDING